MMNLGEILAGSPLLGLFRAWLAAFLIALAFRIKSGQSRDGRLLQKPLSMYLSGSIRYLQKKRLKVCWSWGLAEAIWWKLLMVISNCL